MILADIDEGALWVIGQLAFCPYPVFSRPYALIAGQQPYTLAPVFEYVRHEVGYAELLVPDLRGGVIDHFVDSVS